MDDTACRIIIEIKDWRQANVSYEARASRDGGRTRRLPADTDTGLIRWIKNMFGRNSKRMKQTMLSRH